MRARCLLLAVLLLPGCANPDDIFEVRGGLRSVDPVAGLEVALKRDAPGAFGGCLGDASRPFKTASAGADGGFSFEVFRAQAQSLTRASAFCFRAEVAFPSGSTARLDFTGLAGPLDLAPMRDWRPAMHLDGGVLAFEPAMPVPAALPGVGSGQLTHRLQVWTADGGLVWQADDQVLTTVDRLPLVLDGPRLEDFAGTARLSAFALELPQVDPLHLGPPVTFAGNTFMSAGQGLAVAGKVTPPSRGLPCPALGSPCPLTDGDLTPVRLRDTTTLTLHLPVARQVSAVVLRGARVVSPTVTVLALDQAAAALPPQVVELPLGLQDLQTPPVDLLPDGGVGQSLGYRVWAVVPLDFGAPLSGLTLDFGVGVFEIAEVTLLP